MTEYILLIVIVAVGLMAPLNLLRLELKSLLVRLKYGLCEVAEGTPDGGQQALVYNLGFAPMAGRKHGEKLLEALGE